MPDPSKKIVQSKALLAILFAGSFLNSQLPAACQEKAKSTGSATQQIANQSQLSPEVRAYYLLMLADGYLAGNDRAVLQLQFSTEAGQQGAGWIFRNPDRLEPALISWSDRVSLEGRSSTSEQTVSKEAGQAKTKEVLVLANEAIQAALKQLDKASDPFVELNMYFVASRLFQKSGNTEGLRKCNQILNDYFESCEHSSDTSEKRIKAAASVLNSMAYGFVPLQIADRYLTSQQAAGSYSDKDFKESEKLKLRALALVDRLPSTDHVRRKAHRDMVLWYRQLGEVKLAEKEKQILFELVGSTDDSILYPLSAGCVHLVWWRPEMRGFSGACGMG